MLTVKETEKDRNLAVKEETLVEFRVTDLKDPILETVLHLEGTKCSLGQKLF